MADDDTGRVLSGTVGTLAACLEHLGACEACDQRLAANAGWRSGLGLSMGEDGHVAITVMFPVWSPPLPAPSVVGPAALDESMRGIYEAAGFDFEEVKRTAHAAMEGDRGRLAAAAGASPDGRTEGSQASREGFALNWLLAELRTLHARWISEGKTSPAFADQLNQVANYLLLEASERGD